ncbi:MAG: tannase/feruloyl esterase family alpha/beta hydrolase [Breoghania sp.]|nr:tannase/feruloyl esterase family alpha/beta hydrolase [Breoghania sp.]MDJ0931379.1 tannase/feruloyl esterase family alpha/beta hydrolase [Breoghania sp.]
MANHEHSNNAEQIIPNQKMPTVAKAIFKQCKAQRASNAGGLASDAFLNEPLSCKPDLQALVCEDGEDCFTQAEVDALAKMYDGVCNPQAAERIYYGWPVGSENAIKVESKPGWVLYIGPISATFISPCG